MSNPNTNLVTIFNDHFVEFLTDVHNVFPNDTDILTAKNSLVAIRKANPKLIVRIWLKYVANPYQDKILAGDTEFFIEKDYSNDLTRTGHAQQIMDCIDRIRNPVKEMSPDNQAKAMKYIQNLCKLANMIPAAATI
jgi:hypothetical protein